MLRSKDSRRVVSVDDDAEVPGDLGLESVSDSRDWERCCLDNTVEGNSSAQLPHHECYQSWQSDPKQLFAPDYAESSPFVLVLLFHP